MVVSVLLFVCVVEEGLRDVVYGAEVTGLINLIEFAHALIIECD